MNETVVNWILRCEELRMNDKEEYEQEWALILSVRGQEHDVARVRVPLHAAEEDNLYEAAAQVAELLRRAMER